MSRSFNDLVRERSDIAEVAAAAVKRPRYRLELAAMALLSTAALGTVCWLTTSALHRYGLAGPSGIASFLVGIAAIWLWLKLLVRLSFVVGQRAVVREAARTRQETHP